MPFSSNFSNLYNWSKVKESLHNISLFSFPLLFSIFASFAFSSCSVLLQAHQFYYLFKETAFGFIDFSQLPVCFLFHWFPLPPLFPSFYFSSVQFSSVQFSRSVVSDSLKPHESQHARPPCPSPTPGVYSDLLWVKRAFQTLHMLFPLTGTLFSKSSLAHS